VRAWTCADSPTRSTDSPPCRPASWACTRSHGRSPPRPTRPVAEADIAITLLLLDIEVDGPHHDEPEQQRLDRIRDDRLLALGWTVRRYRAALVTEDEARFRRLVRADILQVAAARGIALRAA
jgi:hypothetical protein